VGIFRRGKTESSEPEESGSDVGELLLQGHDMIEQTASAHAQRWGLGTAERWSLDPAAGTLRWTFPDKQVEAPVQLLGLFTPADSTWTWAWASPSVPPALAANAEAARAWGEEHGQPFLTQPATVVTEEQAADMAAVAFRLCGATGFYRGPSGSVVAYMTFGTVTIRPNEGDEEQFAITVQ
jgi:hypothetical protein